MTFIMYVHLVQGFVFDRNGTEPFNGLPCYILMALYKRALKISAFELIK